MERIPKVPIYLLGGNQTEPMMRARDQILSMVLLPETRNENLTEYYPPGSQSTLELGKLFDEIAGDLSMMSFIAEAPKCVVVTNPSELFTSGGRRPAGRKTKAVAAKTPEDRMIHWLTEELPQTGHHLLFILNEDEAEGRELNDKGPLFQAIAKIGYCRFFRDKKTLYQIEDTLLARDARGCLQAVRDLWKPGKSDSNVYSAIVRSLRYLMQANIARERKLERDPAMQARLFPADRQRNLFQAHATIQKKYLMQPVYRTADLLEAYQGMLAVYRALRPRPDDLFVPDALGLTEQTLARLFLSRRPPNRR